MKTCAALLLLLVWTQNVQSQTPWENGKLAVSQNGRYLQHENGTPFFWQADTCWLLVQKLDREQMKIYFADRKEKGFNVVQTVIVQMLDDQTVYGDSALEEGNIDKLNVTPGSDFSDADQYDYWDHVDYAIQIAADSGVYLAVAPTWSHTVRRAPVTAEQARRYVTRVAERFKDKPNIVWLNGGSGIGGVNADVWQVIGSTIKSIDNNHLMTFHPFGRTQTSTWFNDATWLDFNAFVSGHRRYDQDVEGKAFGEDNWRYVLEDLARTPLKPTLDIEPSYENTPQGLHNPDEPYWTANDARRYAYWSVFAGACGHTYGENSVRQVYLATDAKAASGAKGFFIDRLNAPGAQALQHLKRLMLSRPYFERVNDQAAQVGNDGLRPLEEKYDRVLVTKGANYLMAYVYTGREFRLKLGRTGGDMCIAWWYNPRTGDATKLGSFKNEGERAFDPPGDRANGNDWVLVLDDASQSFHAPGQY